MTYNNLKMQFIYQKEIYIQFDIAYQDLKFKI